MQVRFCWVVGVKFLLFTCIKAAIETKENVLSTDFVVHIS
jgi:hypothetical protein